MTTETEKYLKATPGKWEMHESSDGKCSEITSTSRARKIHEAIAIIPHDDVTAEGEPEIKANAALFMDARTILAERDSARAKCDELTRQRDALREALESMKAALGMAWDRYDFGTDAYSAARSQAEHATKLADSALSLSAPKTDQQGEGAGVTEESA